MASIRLTHHALHRNWMTLNANHTADRQRVGSVTHASNNEAFVTRGSTTTVNHIPMLTVGQLRTEPTFTCCALRATHHLDENLANIYLHIASGTICHHQGIGRGPQHMIGGLSSPSSLRVSRHRSVQLMILVDCYVAHHSIEVSHFVDGCP